MDIQLDKYLEAWFEHDDGDEYLLRYTPHASLKNISNELEILDRFLIDWRNIYHEGKEFKCTPENKMLFMQSALGAERFMWMMQIAVNLTQFKSVEESIKNSNALRNGSTPSQKPVRSAA